MNSPLIAWLREAGNLTLFPHISPDGDTIGSVLALWHALGGKAQIVCDDPVPPKYAFLPGIEAFCTPDMARETEYALAVDAADLTRLGASGALFEKAAYRAVIDHHGTNPRYGQINRIESGYGATGTLVYELLQDGAWQITQEMALCLYVAISTDTGNFSFSSTTRRDMMAAAEMIEKFDLSETTRRLFRLKRKGHTLLLGSMLSGVEFHAAGRVACGFVTDEMMRECGAQYADTEGLIDHLINMEGVEVALLATQKKGSKFSVRTLTVDAAALAQLFGGGGHARAAGMTIDAPLREAMDQVVCAVHEAMK